MTNERQLGDLLMQWEELRQQGKSIAAEDLCADTPELRDELCRRIDALKALDQVLAITPQPRNSAVTCEQAALPAQRELPAIPGYEVLDELGHGGMGVVYQVRNLGIGRVEALKMMLSPKPHMIERFRQEIRAIAQFEHLRVVRIYAAGPADGQPYFTMEYIGRGSLSAHLERFKADRRGAVGLLAKVAQAVHFLHTKNIIHRDLKPRNILLRDEDEPLVSDFGLATFFEREIETDAPEPSGAYSRLSRTGAVIGTTLYMSPEQAGGRTGEFTVATDVWALGVILYELLTGRRPFLGKDEAAVRSAILNTEPDSPRALQPKIDKDLEAICLKCLQKEPLFRYPSAQALADDLENWYMGKPIQARRLPKVIRLARWFGRQWRLSAAVILVLSASFSFFLFQHYYSDPERPLRNMQRTLDRDGRLSILNQNGEMQWFAWRTRKSDFKSLGNGLGAIKFDAFAPVLLEVYRNPPEGGYEFKANVRHDESELGLAGLFFGLSSFQTQKGPVIFFVSLAFNDLEDIVKRDAPGGPKPNPVGLRLQLNGEGLGSSAPVSRRAGSSGSFIPSKTFSGQGPWRELAICGNRECIQWTFTGLGAAVHGELPAAEFFVKARKLLSDNSNELEGQNLEFPPRGGLGLLVEYGAASFKEVAVSRQRD
jgi:serine/threonine protein kinase